MKLFVVLGFKALVKNIIFFNFKEQSLLALIVGYRINIRIIILKYTQIL